jgi:hypothetical protein
MTGVPDAGSDARRRRTSAYYPRHRAEVEAYLAEQESEGAEIQVMIEANDPPEGLRARLLARLEP